MCSSEYSAIVKCKRFGCESVRQQFLCTLAKLGLESLRIDLLPLILLNHHMQPYSLMDISLDTFPYAGTTTTYESLYVGVPCVTMGGSVLAHNVSVSLLRTIETSKEWKDTGEGYQRCVAVLGLVFRIAAAAAAIGATITMGTAEETLPFFTQIFQFHASFDQFPTSTFFVIALSIVAGYLVLSVPFSVVGISQPLPAGPPLLLIVLDTVAMTLAASAAASSAAIVHLAHKGNSSANWLAICRQFAGFCQRISSAVVASFVVAALVVFLVAFSAIGLKKR